MAESAGASPNPKVFISYSWTNPEHEAWVLTLATELRESGVDAILDKWDLKEGNDAHAFMEKMVTDKQVKKVILITDKAYAEKADDRTGGVGTETQIISPEVYAKQTQDKFVAVVREYDAEGRPCVPTFYRSRIFIDFSDDTRYAESFEQLIRWLYDRPLHVRPKLGQKPQFLSDEPNAVSLSTTPSWRRAIDALRNSRGYMRAATAEYLSTFASEFEKMRIDPAANPFEDAVVENIKSFLPYRNQAIELFSTIATHHDTLEMRTELRKFFESIMPYMERPAHIGSYRDWDWDNFKFIIHELFLFAVAIFIRYERFEAARDLVSEHFYFPSPNRAENIYSFDYIRQHTPSLTLKSQQLQRLSYRADLLKERCTGVGLDFPQLQQAEFVLYLKSSMKLLTESPWGVWYPETLAYSAKPFEIFLRARSQRYFEHVKLLLGISDKQNIQELLDVFKNNSQIVPRWSHHSFKSARLMDFQKLATEP